MKRFIISGELMCLIIVIALITSVGVAQAAEPGIYDKGTLFSYHFDGDAADSSGNENNGILGGPNLPAFVDGPGTRFGDAVEVSGGSHIEIPESNTMDTGSEVTIETWIRLKNLNASWSTVYNKHAQSSTAGYHWLFIAQNGSISYQYATGGAYKTMSAPYDWVFDQWTYLAVTHKINGDAGGVVKWYIDGLLISEQEHTDKALEVIGGKGSIGTYQSNPDATRYGLNATLDEFRVSPRVKTDDEIMESMSSLAVEPHEKLADTWGNVKSHSQ